MPKQKTLDKKFTFLLSSEERSDIDELAEKLERSKSDAVRVALRRAIDGVRKIDAEEKADD
jgi:predicted transcriptional regulator